MSSGLKHTYEDTKHEVSSADSRQANMLKLLEDCSEMLGAKRVDYGIDNFKDAAAFLKLATGIELTPMDVAYVLAGIKLSRIRNLRKQENKPLHESITDSIKDFINYTALETRERERYEQSSTQDEEEQTGTASGAHES